MFKLKRGRAQGVCAAMRCKGPATDLLCDRHQAEWVEAGSPALVVDTPTKKDLPTKLQEDLTAERHQLQKVLERIQTVPMTDPLAMDDFAGKVQTRIRELEDLRKAEVGPHNEVVKAINGWFKPVTDLCIAIKDTIRRRRAEAILAAQKAQDAALAQVALGAGDAPADVIVAAHATPETAKNVSQRTGWTFKVVDESVIPDEYWCLDMVKLAQAVKTSGDKCAIPGIVVERTVELTVRGT